MTKKTRITPAANDNAPANRPLTFISMFSGIEAASVAFKPLGWRALAFAEIDKFPSAVLAHHYPDVPNVGDMAKHDWAQYAGKVDVVCGGPPCQDFSIAGLRAGMDGARGGLSITYMRALHAIKPRNAIVENVPGWLNDKKNAFGCFLAGLVGADDPLHTPDGKSWPDAGMVAGPLGRAAWRVLDAQYFGLAQRRRRVLVVADFGGGADPAEVLFEPDGVRRYFAPGRETGQNAAAGVGGGADGCRDVAPTISARTKGGGGLGTDFDLDGGLVETTGTLTATYGEQSGQDFTAGGMLQVAFAPDIARCVATREGSSQDYETTTMVAQTVQAVSVNGDIAHSLAAEGADASEDGTGRGTPVIAFSAKDYGGDATDNLSPTLRAGGHTGSHANAGVMPAIAQTVALRGRGGGGTAELGGDVATALRASTGGGDKPHVLTTQVRRLTPRECERLQGFQWLCAPTDPGAWQDDAGRWWSPDYTRIPVRHYAARKITKNRPADVWEPDGGGGWWLMAADGPRYKALGNSWAVPKFTWLGARIAKFMPAANDNGEALRDAA